MYMLYREKYIILVKSIIFFLKVNIMKLAGWGFVSILVKILVLLNLKQVLIPLIAVWGGGLLATYHMVVLGEGVLLAIKPLDQGFA